MSGFGSWKQGGTRCPSARPPSRPASPDVNPKIATVYRHKVERLSQTLRWLHERDQTAEAIRGLVERIMLTPGPAQGRMDATLRGQLGTIIQWTAAASGKNESDIP